MWIELSNNLEQLGNSNIQVSRFQLLDHPLYSDASSLNPQGMTSASARPPKGTTSQAWRDEKSYYTLNGVEFEFPLADQFASVQQFGGWVRYGRYGLRVRQGKIVEFHISCLPNTFAGIHSHSAVIQCFGHPEQVDEWWDTGELMWTDFVYARGIRLHFDEWDHFIIAVNVGDLLTYDEQGRRKPPEPIFDEG